MTMTYPSQISYRRLFAEGTAIVISILLAFAIEAWWDDRQDRVEEQELLLALEAEFEFNLSRIDYILNYRNTTLASITRMFEAAAGQRTIAPSELDKLLGDLAWSASVEFSTGALNNLIQGGKLRLIENDELVQILAGLPGLFEAVARTETSEIATLKQNVMPFFFKNAFVPQISNTLTGQPGTGDNAPLDVIPIAQEFDHTSLLKNTEFLNVMTLKQWDQYDALWICGKVQVEFERAVELIGAEMNK